MKSDAVVQAVHKKAEGGKIVSQIQEMIKPAAAMLDTYPVVTAKQKIKQWIKTCVPGMTPEKAERYSWPQALLAMGLLQAYEQTKDKTALSSVFSYLRRWKNSGYQSLMWIM